VAAGAVLDARSQATGASRTFVCSLMGYSSDSPGLRGYSRIVSCTDWTNTLPANSVTQTGQTATAWTTIEASTPAALASLFFALSAAADSTRTATHFLIEIAVGSAGNEQVLFSFEGKQSAALIPTAIYSLPDCDIPAGVRLSFRVTCNNAAAADSIAVAAWGVAA